ncbi:MAG: D-alanyl-D-alanine carboxypeptidase/D-alanyl-D-alanine-endopeptidase [Saprospiraceae bacterium]
MRFVALLLLGSLLSCVSARHAERRLSRDLQRRIEQSSVFARSLTGFVLLDPETGNTIAEINGDKYFTPASNTKILTLATCLQVLGDSIPSLQTQRHVLNSDENRSILLVRGTGDPTFLHPRFQYWQLAFDWLKSQPDTLQILPRQSAFGRYGPGWAWDDYQDDYQAERSILPMYGNTVRLAPDLLVEPPFFKNNFLGPIPAKDIERREHENLWVLPAMATDQAREHWLPFTRVDLGQLLGDTLGRPVEELAGGEHEYVPENWHTHYSAPLDTVLRRMMYQSDNFVAEQLLIVCSGQKFGVLQPDLAIRWMLDSVFADLPQRPRWVDGSGLSRYNLATPRMLARVLQKLWASQPHERLLNLFPASTRNPAGSAGDAKMSSQPFVFAKTGGMSGIHCLSGYLVTARGKTLVFSFMHNNFVGSNKPWRTEMQQILEYIHQKG